MGADTTVPPCRFWGAAAGIFPLGTDRAVKRALDYPDNRLVLLATRLVVKKGVGLLLQVRRQGNLCVAAVIHHTRDPSGAPYGRSLFVSAARGITLAMLKHRDSSNSDQWRGCSQRTRAHPTHCAAWGIIRVVRRPSRGTARLAPLRVRCPALPVVDSRARRGGCLGRYRRRSVLPASLSGPGDDLDPVE